MQRAMAHFFKFLPGNQLITLDQLSKFEALSFNGFPDIKFSISKFTKGDNSKKLNDFFLIFT